MFIGVVRDILYIILNNVSNIKILCALGNQIKNVAKYRIQSNTQNILLVIMISLHGYYKSHF